MPSCGATWGNSRAAKQFRRGDSLHAMTEFFSRHRAAGTGFRILSRDKHVFEMYDPAQGDAKVMEIIYTRE